MLFFLKPEQESVEFILFHPALLWVLPLSLDKYKLGG